MSAGEAARAVNALSNGDKYQLLTNHFQPSANFPIVTALEVIGLGLHGDDLSDNFRDAAWAL